MRKKGEGRNEKEGMGMRRNGEGRDKEEGRGKG